MTHLTVDTNIHPDGQRADATMSVLEDGTCVSIAVSLDASISRSGGDLTAKLREMFNGMPEGVASVTIQTGDDRD